MLTMREIVKTLYSALVNKLSINMKKYRGNWAQNDSNADDYIQNRPFYTERSNNVILSNATIVSNYNVSYTTEPLIVNRTYNVVFDGISYECVCREYNGYLMLGNNAIYEYDNGILSDTGEPFAAEAYGGDPDCLWWYFPDGDVAAHTVSISYETSFVEKMSAEYLPDAETYLPENVLRPDYNICDETQSGYIHNRPCYYEEGVKINASDLQVSGVGMGGYIGSEAVHNYVFHPGHTYRIVGEIGVKYDNWGVFPWTIDLSAQAVESGVYFSLGGLSFSAEYTLPVNSHLHVVLDGIANYSSDHTSWAGKLQGYWMADYNMTGVSVSFDYVNLHCYSVKQLDEIMIPDTIARKSDIPEIPDPVQPDWNQNDETAADYVKNRTHFDAQYIAHFDFNRMDEYETLPDFRNAAGSTPTLGGGRACVYYRISDLTPSIEKLWENGKRRQLTWRAEGNMVEESDLLDVDREGSNFNYWSTESFAFVGILGAREPLADLFIVYKENTVLPFGPTGHNFNTYTAIASKPGIYIHVGGTTTGMQAVYGHLEWGETVPLDEKFIPDTIARKSDIPDIPVPVQPDLSQNDPNAADYVKNRTHYKTNGELFNGTVVVEEGWNVGSLDLTILEGERYVVLFDGVEYDLVGKPGEYIGNEGLWYEEGATDGQPPFAYGQGWLAASDGEHTFVVTGNMYTRIDKKYLPVDLVQNVEIDYGSTPDEVEAARILFAQGAQLRIAGELVISQSGSMGSGLVSFGTHRGDVVFKSDGTCYIKADFLYWPPHSSAIADGEYVANEQFYLRSSGGKTFKITVDDSGTLTATEV